MSETGISDKFQQAAEHVAFGARHAAFAMQDVDRAAQFLVAGHARFVTRQIDAEQPQHAAHERFDRADDRPEHRHEEGDGRRDQQRHAVGVGDGDRLGQHLAEDDDQRRHDDGRVDDALVADGDDEHAGGERRGGDRHELAAEQHRADQPAAVGDQPVGEPRALVAARLQRLKARARGRGERGLGAGEKGGGDEAGDDQERGEVNRHSEIIAQGAEKEAERIARSGRSLGLLAGRSHAACRPSACRASAYP